MTQISILGCGWLGFPLAKVLIEKGFSVHGSTTSTEKLSILQKSGIQAFLIALENNSISGDIVTFLEGSKTLVIDIPPKLRGNSKEDFVGKIETLIDRSPGDRRKQKVYLFGEPSAEGKRNAETITRLLRK